MFYRDAPSQPIEGIIQKLSFEGRHLFDSLNKSAVKRSAAVVF
ncbi:hypothetical protein NT01EI_0642 [Edwardsiella ictaluri 93-146]|uniref:Uncharacterized protein n=1 Tax=Edwardsiella ictaluri (strain 93-146) TaxID=634503 RepID=C5B791_EDWI9|nr:hypothetical protein NT01EI_0642 [Edwardsiella ictaluri 93-146]